MRMQVRSLSSLSGLRIQCCHELCCRLQMGLRSRVAVAVEEAGSCSSDSTPSLGTSKCHRYGPKKTKRQKKNSVMLNTYTYTHKHICIHVHIYIRVLTHMHTHILKHLTHLNCVYVYADLGAYFISVT